MVVYKITNKINGKFYIGQTIKPVMSRWLEHINSAKKFSTSRLHKAISKYGADSFFIETVHSVSSIEELNKYEIMEIQLSKATDPNIGYNTAPGGKNPYRWLSNTERLSLKSGVHPLTGVPQKPELISKRLKSLSENLLLKSPTYKAQVRIRQRINKIKNRKNKPFLAKKGDLELGFLALKDFAQFADCSPAQVSMVLSGRNQSVMGWSLSYVDPILRASAEDRRRIIATRFGAKKRAIICLETGEQFESSSKAASILSIGRTSITNNLNKRSGGCRLPNGTKVTFKYRY